MSYINIVILKIFYYKTCSTYRQKCSLHSKSRISFLILWKVDNHLRIRFCSNTLYTSEVPYEQMIRLADEEEWSPCELSHRRNTCSIFPPSSRTYSFPVPIFFSYPGRRCAFFAWITSHPVDHHPRSTSVYLVCNTTLTVSSMVIIPISYSPVKLLIPLTRLSSTIRCISFFGPYISVLSVIRYWHNI